MALTDTRLRTLKPEKGKDERLVADGNGLYIRIRSARGEFARTWQIAHVASLPDPPRHHSDVRKGSGGCSRSAPSTKLWHPFPDRSGVGETRTQDRREPLRRRTDFSLGDRAKSGCSLLGAQCLEALDESALGWTTTMRARRRLAVRSAEARATGARSGRRCRFRGVVNQVQERAPPKVLAVRFRSDWR
jgi:hypothetical protein